MRGGREDKEQTSIAAVVAAGGQSQCRGLLLLVEGPQRIKRVGRIALFRGCGYGGVRRGMEEMLCVWKGGASD